MFDAVTTTSTVQRFIQLNRRHKVIEAEWVRPNIFSKSDQCEVCKYKFDNGVVITIHADDVALVRANHTIKWCDIPTEYEA